MIVCAWKDLEHYAPIIHGLKEAIDIVSGLKTMEPAVYMISDGGRVVVQQGTTLPVEGGKFEAHRKYLDIQYIVKGKETVGWAPLDNLTPDNEFDTEADIGMYTGHADFITINQGNCYVVFPEDAHMPGRHLDTPNEYRKIVIKLKV